MSDRLKQIAFFIGLPLAGILVGIYWHDRGGEWWVIPLLAIGFPIIAMVVIIAVAFFRTDWSH